MQPPKPRIGLIGNHRVCAEAVASTLDRDGRMEVAWTTVGPDAGIDCLLASAVELVLIDLDLPGGDAFDACERLRRERPEIKRVFLAGRVSEIAVELAMRLEVRGFLSKNEPIDALLEHIGRVAAGECRFSQEVRERLEYDPRTGCYAARSDTPLASLTVRQLEILRYLARGESVKRVAQKLFLSPKSVENHKYRIMSKLGIHDRVHLTCYALREGLIQL